ncbi:MAG TPA: hypothetical protein VN851_08285 [Thermoanaerobaculia bacterium]|nr:hypothetical protein [Thermoanaerobaculia bacterium]
MKIAYFTAGTVGAGHQVRGLAIRRGLARSGFSGEFRAFGPEVPFPAARGVLEREVVSIEGDRIYQDRHLAPASPLAEKLRAYAPDLLLVDLFWAPLYWILPQLSCPAWLLLRLCPPVWLQGPQGMPFRPEPFERIVAIEPIEHPVLTDRLDPIVVANPEDCRPPHALRDLLAHPAGRALAVVAHAGKRGEIDSLREALGEDGSAAAVLDLFAENATFPAAEWLGGADRIALGAGYNSFWEAHWLGYAERTAFVPFQRSIDDQARRLRDFRSIPKENGADRLARWILAG